MSDGAPEQSMEDILASIKKIITADSDAARHVPAIAPTPSEPDDGEEDVLELGAPEPAPPAAPDDSLLSGATAQASKAALAALTSLTIDPKAEDNTLDGLVRELLRPMLKQWLDANLPALVERIVAREVARVVGR